uniref:Uncharacterized protein n=1 Tax=Alexandrium catenella TaxID=2925 RepID=A0A7S1Q0D6_ALECA
MGDSSSKAALAVQDSPSCSGLKSVVSAPLDAFLQPERFWELYEKQARAGFTMSYMGSLTGGGVTSHDCKDLEDGSFEISDVVNGGMFGGGEMKLLMRHTFDKEKKEWSTKMFDKSFDDGELKETIHIKELSSPFRVEAWADVNAQRIGDAGVAAIETSLLGEVLKRAGKDGAIVCKESAEASDGKTCALSEALDASITPDQFWTLYIGFVKEGLQKPGLKEHKCEDIGDGNFVVVDTFDTGLVTHEKFVFDAAKDTLVSCTHENDATMSEASCIDSYHTKVLRDPLRVEFWKEVTPGRKTATNMVGVLGGGIDSCLNAA